MKNLFVFIFITLFIFSCGIDDKNTQVNSKNLSYIELIVKDFPTSLRPDPNSTITLIKIPVGTILIPLEEYNWVNSMGTLKVKWYKINYKDYTGWISEHTVSVTVKDFQSKN